MTTATKIRADLHFLGRPVEVSDWEGKGVDSFIATAYWLDTGDALTEDEIEALQDSDEGQNYLVEQNFERYGYWMD